MLYLWTISPCKVSDTVSNFTGPIPYRSLNRNNLSTAIVAGTARSHTPTAGARTERQHDGQ